MARSKSPKKSGIKQKAKLKSKTKSITKRKRGRPKGKVTKAKQSSTNPDGATPKKRGRPRKIVSDSKKETVSLRKANVKKLEEEILSGNIEASIETVSDKKIPRRDMLEQIMFKVPCVMEPLMGTPKQVQRELDGLAKRMQKRPVDEFLFNKIHLYMHGYLINVVLKKFPFIRGLQSVDIYQETLIALRFKAIPNFKNNRGMSFLNFAKMCIRRHLITLLNTAHNRKRDQSMNRAISLDSSPLTQDDDGSGERNTFANIITDNAPAVDKVMENNEAYSITKTTLLTSLSPFEKTVFLEYLSSSSYREISKEISKRLDRRYNTKSIDNALLRIRKKATHLMSYGKVEDIPLFMYG